MVWLIVGCAVCVLALAAYAGTGRLGQMQDAPVTDRPRGRVASGPITAELLSELRIPLALSGYDPAAVDDYLDSVAGGTADPLEEVRFRVVRRGYDMQVVDALLARAQPSSLPDGEDETTHPARAAIDTN